MICYGFLYLCLISFEWSHLESMDFLSSLNLAESDYIELVGCYCSWCFHLDAEDTTVWILGSVKSIFLVSGISIDAWISDSTQSTVWTLESGEIELSSICIVCFGFHRLHAADGSLCWTFLPGLSSIFYLILNESLYWVSCTVVHYRKD